MVGAKQLRGEAGYLVYDWVDEFMGARNIGRIQMRHLQAHDGNNSLTGSLLVKR